MYTSQWIQRIALSAALLVLPLIIYCSEISESPHPGVGSAGQTEAVPSSGPDATHGTPNPDPAQARKILADMKNSPRPGS
jgi:hypothetical protein